MTDTVGAISTATPWAKSPRSMGNGQCILIRAVRVGQETRIQVSDSKNPHLPPLDFSTVEWGYVWLIARTDGFAECDLGAPVEVPLPTGRTFVCEMRTCNQYTWSIVDSTPTSAGTKTLTFTGEEMDAWLGEDPEIPGPEGVFKMTRDAWRLTHPAIERELASASPV